MKKYVLTVFTFFIIIILSFSTNTYGEENNKNKENILLISSYDPNFISFNDQIKGLKDSLGKEYELQIEYMDAKRFKSLESEETFYNLLRFKIKNYKKFDAIVLADDVALKFAIKYKDVLFDSIPMFFLGVTEEENIEYAKNAGIEAGVIEYASITDNVELISNLNPPRPDKNLVLITGNQTKYKREINEFYSLEDKYKQFNFKYIEIPPQVNDEFLSTLNSLDKSKDIVLFLYPYRDGVEKTISVLDSIDIITKNVKSHVYTSLSYDLDINNTGVKTNMIGGKVIDHYEQGKIAGKLLDDVLNGKLKTQKFVSDDKANKWIFNYSNLVSNNINEYLLPKGSIVINKPIGFWEKYQEFIIPSIITVVGMILIILALILYLINSTKHKNELIKAKKIAEDANNAKNNFISNISHELRTPVAVIASSNQLLRKLLDSDNGEYKESFYNNLDIITQNSNRLLRLINNIIDIAKIDSGFKDLNLQNIDVISLIEDSVMSVIPYAQSKDLEVIFDTNIEELIMSVDSQKIERIILNLLSNAIKFSYEGGQIFTNIVVENNILTFTVADKGIGISKENLDKIFDKFIQIDNSFTRNNEGSGIGLSLVKSLVKLHGGTVSVESKIKKGTSFTIRLPIEIIDDSNEDTEIPSTNSQTNIELSDIFK